MKRRHEVEQREDADFSRGPEDGLVNAGYTELAVELMAVSVFVRGSDTYVSVFLGYHLKGLG